MRVLLILALGLTACSVKPLPEGRIVFACTDDGECPDGQTCDAGKCRAVAVTGEGEGEAPGEGETPGEGEGEGGAVDADPPTTILDDSQAPPVLDSSAEVTFSFSCVDVSLPCTFSCTLDDGDPSPCDGGTATYSGIAEGEHVFTVCATDAAGLVDPECPSWTWTADLTAPDTVLDASRVAPLTQVREATFIFSSDDADAGFLCQVDDQDPRPCASAWTLLDVPDGDHTFQVTAVDLAGNPDPSPESFPWTIRNVASNVELVDGLPAQGAFAQSRDIRVVFQWVRDQEDPPTDAYIACSLDDAPALECASPFTAEGLADGPHVVEVVGTDSLGNVQDPPPQWAWQVDTRPPTTVVADPPGLTKEVNGTLEFACDEEEVGPCTFTCSLDGAQAAACDSPWAWQGAAHGPHTVTVAATDAAGNAEVAPVDHPFTVDTQVPEVAVTSDDPDGDQRMALVAFDVTGEDVTGEDVVGVTCSLDAGEPQACDGSVGYGPLTLGEHRVVVAAQDAAGNVGEATVVWTIERPAPTATLDWQEADPTGNTDARFDFSCDDQGCTFQCTLDAQDPAPCTSPALYPDLAAGNHTFEVVALDVDGRESAPVQATWTIDGGLATVSVVSGPEAEVASSRVRFELECSDPPCQFVCSLDGGEVEACDASHEVFVQELGPHRLTTWRWWEGVIPPVGPRATHTWTLVPGWEQVDAATVHTCGIRTDGALYCWGEGQWGKLGDGKGENRARPTRVGDDRWRQVSVAQSHTCAVKIDDTAWCWGNGLRVGAEISYDSEHVRDPRRVHLGDDPGQEPGVKSVSAGTGATCAIDHQGRRWCWGQNHLGQANADPALAHSQLPTLSVAHESPVDVVDMGSQHGCQVAQGSVRCWGSGEYRAMGQAPESLGDCDGLPCSHTARTVVHPNGDPWVHVAAGSAHTCAVDVNGAGYCWGNRRYGQTGEGETHPSQVPVTSLPLEDSDWQSMASGGWRSCGIREDGSLWCWGAYAWGQREDGVVETEYCSTFPCRTRPTQVVLDGTTWRQVAVGGLHTCAITDGGALHCWGETLQDRQGDGLRASVAVPTEIPGDWEGATVTASQDSTAVVDGLGRRWVWGQNTYGSLGDGDNADRLSPHLLDDGPWREVVADYFHGCGVTTDGILWCWGKHNNLYFGAGPNHPADNPALSPVQVESDLELSRIRFTNSYYGGGHGCGLGGDGSLWCWGKNHVGQLGDGTANDSAVPVQEASASAWSDLDVFTPNAGPYTCGIKVGGSLWCWGSGGTGQLGLGDIDNRSVPSRVAPEVAMGWLDVATGGGHTCAIRDDGSAWCWGKYSEGQLGDGNSGYGGSLDEPTPVLGEHRFTQVTAGGVFFTCAIDEDQGLWCWGDNTRGQVGDGTRTEQTVPTQVRPGDRWRSVSAGKSHVCAMTADDRLFCWGLNTSGQVGVSPRDFRIPGLVTLP